MSRSKRRSATRSTSRWDKNQRDYYLHEQLNIISSELGEGDDTHAEAEDYRRRILELHLEEDSEAKLLKEVDRLAKMQGSNQEATVIRTYLDTCLDLPWNTFTEDDLDINKAQEILDHDHYGLKKVKDRILELLAVRKLAPDVKAQIICLVGPPGVGKTSIARSIARCLHRKYVRLSLGGVRDEAEIRGHRPHLHRRHARQDHQRHDHAKSQKPPHPAGRDRQAGRRLPGRPGCRPAGGAGPRAEQHLQGPLPGYPV